MNVKFEINEDKIADEIIKAIKNSNIVNEYQNITVVYNAEEKDFLYTVKEVSELLKSNVDYVHNLRKAKLLPFLKLGSYKVRRAALLEFLAKYEGYDLTDPFNIKLLDLSN